MKILYITVTLLLNILLINSECPMPYSSCNLGKPGFVNVHIVPHTHVNH